MNFNVISDGVEKLTKKLQGWGESAIAEIPNFILALVVLTVFWMASAWVYKLVSNSLNKSHLNENLKHLLASTVKISFFCLGIVVALGVLDLQKTVFSLLAGVGVLGLALGFAFRDLAANFVSGIMLAINSPFKNGDVVKIKGIQGTVQDIRLRDTLIRNFDGQDVFIPNKEFLSNEFLNYSSYGKRKIKIEVGIGYEDNQTEGVEKVLSAVKANSDILKDPAPKAFISSLGGSSVNIEAHAWIEYPGESYLMVRNDLTSQIKTSLEESGFNIPFPIRTLEAGESLKKLSEVLGSSKGFEAAKDTHKKDGAEAAKTKH